MSETTKPELVKSVENPRLIFMQGTLASFAAYPEDSDNPEQISAIAIKCLQNREQYLYVAYPKARNFHLIQLMIQVLGDKYSPMLVSNQGFLTSHGRYVARTEARLIAEAQDQLLKGAYASHQLHSEDIW